MTGYIRQDTSNNIANGNVVDAEDLDNEFNAIEATFAVSGGHTHDGTVGGGAPITFVGPTKDVEFTSTEAKPKTTEVFSFGTALLKFKQLFIKTITADEGTVGGSAIATVGGTQTLTNKTLTSPTLDGTPTAPTATAGTNTTQVATTAFVNAERSNTATLTNKTINLSDNTLVATSAQLASALTDETGSGSVVFSQSPTLTGTPTAPTAAAGTNTTQLATTAHVFAERSNTATLTNKTLTSPTINGGSISGITDLAVADGGTGASTAADARNNLDAQQANANLTSLSGLTLAADEGLYATGVNTLATYTLTPFARTLLDDADAAAARTTIGALATSDLVTRTQDQWNAGTDTTEAVISPAKLATVRPPDAHFAGAGGTGSGTLPITVTLRNVITARAALASNTFTLQPGQYFVQVSASVRANSGPSGNESASVALMTTADVGIGIVFTARGDRLGVGGQGTSGFYLSPATATGYRLNFARDSANWNASQGLLTSAHAGMAKYDHEIMIWRIA